MIELSLDAINNKAPYHVDCVEHHDGYFTFSTDFGVNYTVGFDVDDLIQSDISYQFVLINIDNTKSPRDHKVRDTIRCIVEEFFAKNNNSLLYLCETGDRKQAMRNRLFEHWFSTYKFNSLYTFHSAVVDAEGIENYVAIIMRIDNPNLTNVLMEFGTAIQTLQNKPSESAR